VNCLSARALLPELAVGILPEADREDVERHLRWCAGCRKEASDLGQGAATLAFALAPVQPPAELEDRVVARVRRAAEPRAAPRRLRTTIAAAVAATVAVASLGWGAVMAGRADRFAERVARANQDRAAALERFRRVLEQVIPDRSVPQDETHMGQLAPSANGQGGGAVLELVSPTTIDFSMVIVNGLDTGAADRLPYRVQLFKPDGEMLRAGRITELDANGGAEVFRQFDQADLTGYTSVRIVDARGQVVLTGTVDQG
jgi:hypothetical protein